MKRIEQPASVFGFVQKLLVVQDEPLSEVIRQIETLCGVRIVADAAIEKNRITTHLDLNRMEEVIQELAELCQCQYQKTDEQNYRLFSK